MITIILAILSFILSVGMLIMAIALVRQDVKIKSLQVFGNTWKKYFDDYNKFWEMKIKGGKE